MRNRGNNISLMPVRGDSIFTTLKNQSLIIVNRIEQIVEDGIYIFNYDGQLRVNACCFRRAVTNRPQFRANNAAINIRSQ